MYIMVVVCKGCPIWCIVGGTISEFECKCKTLSVENIRANILVLGYSERMIKSIFF